jgi:predicted alpha/beta superfamily hydrolase
VPDVVSPQLGNRRDLFVYLPRSYESGSRRYPVIYAQDGQNLFDAATSYAGPWHLGPAIDALPDDLEPIVVGVANAGEARIDEYSPIADAQGRGGRGDRYLAFLTSTVKPMIDAQFRTRPGPETTGVAGSSMGGLISLYAFFGEPATFGFAGVLSPSLWFAGSAVLRFVKAARYRPGRLYVDIGLSEGAPHVANARRLRDLLVGKGYRAEVDLRFVEDPDGAHNEAAWGRRFRAALPFLLGGAAGER